MQPKQSRIGWVLAGMAIGVCAACTRSPAALTQLIEARRLASELHVQFTRATEASNRAVMSERDDEAIAAAQEARRARGTVDRDVEALHAILQSSSYGEDLRFLEGFKSRFHENRQVDDEILPLAVENTNVKAQRLSFGPAREASNQFRSAIDRALKAGDVRDRWQAEALAARAIGALLQIQVLHAPHIAEADLTAMTQMEEQMAASERDARANVQQLKRILPPAAAPQLAAATAALDRFNAINRAHRVLTAQQRRDIARAVPRPEAHDRGAVRRSAARAGRDACQASIHGHAMTSRNAGITVCRSRTGTLPTAH